MCPNGLIIPFSQTAHIVLTKSSASPSTYMLPHVREKKRKSGNVNSHHCICRSDTWASSGSGDVCSLADERTVWSSWFRTWAPCLSAGLNPDKRPVGRRLREHEGGQAATQGPWFHNANDFDKNCVLIYCSVWVWRNKSMWENMSPVDWSTRRLYVFL